MDRERTADTVSSTQPNIPGSNCGEKKIKRKVDDNVCVLRGKRRRNFSHLLNMLLKDQLQVFEVLHSQTGDLEQRRVVKRQQRKAKQSFLVMAV